MMRTDWEPIRVVPDCEVTLDAREYLEAAKICLDNDLYWVSGVNAAFAIELLLKAYLIEEHRGLAQKRTRKASVKAKGKNPKNGHGLMALYQTIPASVRERIEIRAESSLPKFLDLMKKCDGVFENARYAFERDKPQKLHMRNTDLLDLAGFLSGIAVEMQCVNPAREETEIKMTQQKFLPFALPDIGEDEINEVVDALRSGWVTTGPKTRQFEADFAAYIGGGVEAIAVNSATAGLHLALEAVGIKEGDEVIVPSYTFTATAEVVRYLGAHPVCVDVDPVTFNICPDAIRAAITDKTRAIMPVHFAGLACDMDTIIAIARAHGLKVVEDAAHAMPTYYKGTLVGALDSDVTVFSFYANKTMTTGEGGMVVSRHADIIARCKIMRLHGISRDAFDRYTSTTPAWYYEVVAPGYKYNMPDTAAAMGIHQLKKIDAFLQKREAMAARYDAELAGLPLTLPAHPADAGSNHAWHLYPVRLQPQAGISRDDFIVKMAELGIGCSVHFIPLHRQPVWRDTYGLTREQFPVADAAFEAEVTLPLYTRMSDDDQTRVIAAVRQLLGQ